MNKKTAILITLLIGGLFITIIANKLYYENVYEAVFLTCKYNSPYETYNETLEFSFVDDILHDFKRHEVFEATKDHPIDEIYEYFIDMKKEMYEGFVDSETGKTVEADDSFYYKVKKKDNKYVMMDTYFNIDVRRDDFSNYMQEKKINSYMNYKKVMSKLKDDYTCTYEKK